MNRFHRPPDDWTLARLALPRARPRVVLDTDAANEIDDQFAIAWALLSPEELRLEAVYAAPFSFEYRRGQFVRAKAARDKPGAATPEDRELLRHLGARLATFEKIGWDPLTVRLPGFEPPLVGMERSYDEILKVFDCVGESPAGRVFRGSAAFLHSLDAPPPSPAAGDLVARAMASPADDPLYVLAIGCLTNIAAALLTEPRIVERIVVVWTAGYPSHASQVNYAFNLEEDRLACDVVLGSGVPFVYLPGYHVGAQLRLSLPEMERYVKRRGAIGEYLFHLYTHNPLWPLSGTDSFYAHSWVIWDVINVAWVLRSEWVPTDLVRTPRLGADLRWERDESRPWMREAFAIQRDAIFRDFFLKLAALP